MIWLQLKWSPISFGPLTFLDTKKFGPREIWSLHENYYIAFSCRNQLTKFLGDQISWEPNFSGTKFLGDQKSQGPKWDRGLFQLQPQKATIGLEKRRRRLKYFRAWLAQLLKQSFFEYVRGFSRVQSAILRAAVRYVVVVRGSAMVRLVENHPNSDSFLSFMAFF